MTSFAVCSILSSLHICLFFKVSSADYLLLTVSFDLNTGLNVGSLDGCRRISDVTDDISVMFQAQVLSSEVCLLHWQLQSRLPERRRTRRRPTRLRPRWRHSVGHHLTSTRRARAAAGCLTSYWSTTLLGNWTAVLRALAVVPLTMFYLSNSTIHPRGLKIPVRTGSNGHPQNINRFYSLKRTNWDQWL